MAVAASVILAFSVAACNSAQIDYDDTNTATFKMVSGGNEAKMRMFSQFRMYRMTIYGDPLRAFGLGLSKDGVLMTIYRPNDQKQCVGILYKISKDGSLSGETVNYHTLEKGSEQAVPIGVKNSGITEYELTGEKEQFGGKPKLKYSGKLQTIDGEHGVDNVVWTIDGGQAFGKGMRLGNFYAASIGDEFCRVGIYQLDKQGTWVGSWNGDGPDAAVPETLENMGSLRPSAMQSPSPQ